MTAAALQLDMRLTEAAWAPPKVAQICVCLACGGVRAAKVTAHARVTPGEVRTVVCGGCRRVGEDLVRALGLPPDAEGTR